MLDELGQIKRETAGKGWRIVISVQYYNIQLTRSVWYSGYTSQMITNITKTTQVMNKAYILIIQGLDNWYKNNCTKSSKFVIKG